MKRTIIFFIFVIVYSMSYGQHRYTSRIGSKFFPGHADIVITVEGNTIRYEMFNHWYVSSYAELRQITIRLDSLDLFNERNDTIIIKILNNKIHLIDKSFRINKKIRHKKLCASPETMRKISYAYKVSEKYNRIRHYELYKREDFELSENEFKKRVDENLDKLKNQTNGE